MYIYSYDNNIYLFIYKLVNSNNISSLCKQPYASLFYT